MHRRKTDTGSREVFDKYDKDKDESLSLNEVAALFMDVSRKCTTLPAVR